MQEKVLVRRYDGKMAVFLGRGAGQSKHHVLVRVGTYELTLLAKDWERLPAWRAEVDAPEPPGAPVVGGMLDGRTAGDP